MPMWSKILLAIFLVIMIVKLWPAAKHMMKHGPKGSADDWKAALLPIAAVVGFVIFLILMVRG
ncbi:hypothetical protein DFR30_1413 [Thiogranum longum]|uniref:Uncharacterized protein n=1 Tax=Thiogranum longum TaxID=1537524 RepID=A0A4R1HFN6_9GAMM|nr:hypothetical protein [Thiogranum longum]TCK18149.1 hypothetical protein DFR30_1413 [Thiogranum longum]